MEITDETLGEIVRKCVKLIVEELNEPSQPFEFEFMGEVIIHTMENVIRKDDIVLGNKVLEALMPHGGDNKRQMLRLYGPKPFAIIAL